MLSGHTGEDHSQLGSIFVSEAGTHEELMKRANAKSRLRVTDLILPEELEASPFSINFLLKSFPSLMTHPLALPA